MGRRLMGSLSRVIDSSTIEIRVHDEHRHGSFMGPAPEDGRIELVHVEGVMDAAGVGKIASVDTAEALGMLLRDKRLFCAVQRLDTDGQPVAEIIAVSYMSS